MDIRTISLLVLIVFVINGVECKRNTHRYEIQEEVPFYVNKIGPYRNPSETYEFYSLPFCPPHEIQHSHHSVGEDLTGDHKVNSVYDLRFRGMKIILFFCCKSLK